MLETIITVAIVLGAVVWFLRWLRGASRGDGCSCGKCAKNCPGVSRDCLRSGEAEK